MIGLYVISKYGPSSGIENATFENYPEYYGPSGKRAKQIVYLNRKLIYDFLFGD